jgi:phospholipid transport system substrate-binding protein
LVDIKDFGKDEARKRRRPCRLMEGFDMLPRAMISMLAATILLLTSTAASAAGEQEAQTFIRDLAQNAITTVAARNISDAERDANFRHLFISAFDIPEIGKFVLSRQWRLISPEKQGEFLKEFENTQVVSWGRRFKTYNGVRLEALGARVEGDNVWLVDSRIIRPQATPVSVQWRVHRDTAATLRITDIIVAGASMILTHRDDYTAALRGNGGSIDALLATMRARNEQERPLATSSAVGAGK